MKIGDKVKFRSARDKLLISDTLYKIIEVGDSWLKLLHPEIGGYFTFKKTLVAEVISED